MCRKRRFLVRDGGKMRSRMSQKGRCKRNMKTNVGPSEDTASDFGDFGSVTDSIRI